MCFIASEQHPSGRPAGNTPGDDDGDGGDDEGSGTAEHHLRDVAEGWPKALIIIIIIIKRRSGINPIPPTVIDRD